MHALVFMLPFYAQPLIQIYLFPLRLILRYGVPEHSIEDAVADGDLEGSMYGLKVGAGAVLWVAGRVCVHVCVCVCVCESVWVRGCFTVL
jgi:hypothetical protein